MIRATAQLQSEHGTRGVALSEVIELSRAPRGSIYHHFPEGKAQLVGEATQYGGTLVGDTLDALIDGTTSPEELLTVVAGYWAATLEATGFRAGCPVAAGALDDDDSSARTVAAVAFARWSESLSGHLTRRGIPEAEAGDLAVLTIAAFEGALILARAHHSTEPLHQVFRALAASVRQR